MINKSEIEFYQKHAGKSYDKHNVKDVETKDRLFELIKKITTCAKKARASLFGDLVDKKSFTQLSHAVESKKHSEIRSYLFTRFSPENKYSQIATYWFFVEGRPEYKDKHFRISLSLFDKKSTEPLIQKNKTLQAQFKLEDSRSIDVDIPEDELTQWIVNSIKGFELSYENFCEELEPELNEALSNLERIDLNIWKMSHGKERQISKENHEWLINNNSIAIGWGPEHSQRKKFERMKVGDYFYLVRNSRIVLFGQIDGTEIINIPDHLNQSGWVMRKFKKIQDAVIELKSTEVPGKQGWKPQNNSTINLVKKSELTEFEETILEPVFGLSLIELLDGSETNLSPKQNINEGQMKMRNKILYGPPGTGKTFNTINEALKIADPDFALAGKTREELKSRFDELINEGQIVFTTFHQSMSYEDFIEGIKPEISNGSDTENDNVKYEIKPGIFKKICESAKIPNQFGFETAYKNLQKELRELKDKDSEPLTLKTATGKDFSIALNSQGNLTLFTSQGRNQQGSIRKENIQKYINHGEGWWESYVKGILNYLKTKHQYSEKDDAPQKNYVLIIDEINRGNVSQIFGELITLIEDDKRLGMLEALEVTLPYSKERFGVPKNLYIIGTMNTADRSVEALDAALRRRFSFIEKAPEAEIIIREGFNGGEIAGVQLSEVLKTINKRLEKLLDKDHQIGHCYFLGIDNEEKLAKTFNNKIVPLLREYFFGDYGKIGLVLGSGFIQKTKDADKEPWAIFDYDASDYDNKDSYQIIDINSANILAAIESLLPKKDENGEE
jgi:5-methylcytosine-specific restriction protein B